MEPSARLFKYVVCMILAACSLTSCGGRSRYTVTAQDIPTLGDNGQPTIPLRAGFYMDDACRELEYAGRDRRLYIDGPRAYYSVVLNTNPDRRIIEFDAQAAFAHATRRMFQEIVPLTATDTVDDFKAKDLDVIVSVGRPVCLCEIEAHHPKALIEFYVHTMNVRVAADWAITSPDGKLVTSTKPVGEGRAKLDRNGACCRDALTMALDAHFKKAYADIVMTAWWRHPSWRGE